MVETRKKNLGLSQSLNDFLTNTGSKGNCEARAYVVNSKVMEYAYDVRCALSDTEHHRTYLDVTVPLILLIL